MRAQKTLAGPTQTPRVPPRAPGIMVLLLFAVATGAELLAATGRVKSSSLHDKPYRTLTTGSRSFNQHPEHKSVCLGCKNTHMGLQWTASRAPNTSRPSECRAQVHLWERTQIRSPLIHCLREEQQENHYEEFHVAWGGPNGRLVPGENTKEKHEGTWLILHGMLPNMSGPYQCVLSYKEKETHTLMRVSLSFIVYAYREVQMAHTFLVNYYASSCTGYNNNLVLDQLVVVLNGLLRRLYCKVVRPMLVCQSIVYRDVGRQYLLEISFVVDPYGKNWLKTCDGLSMKKCEVSLNLREKEASNIVESFFKKQERIVRFLETLPSIYLIGGSLYKFKDAHCMPGYGKDKIIHPDCSSCCGCSRWGTSG
ncbi:zona pellucida-binding protein 2-like isoform X3 [Lethenteron reissneri]|uniref:zona pellucida-binding protein 2-like isoform X3 n=1 Tax=Lethenteron reissneri TaxID=7753 RepID=UPI002AB6C8DA|nr:zona pellucida-binding protein 2-like isoform X3 [Lethenteron reissneri]